jgi:hypothetical protein
MSRFDELTQTVEAYQGLAAENYDRIRQLAHDLRQGLCDYIGASDGPCVHLVPPAGAFEPRAYGDQAFSMAPRGFRALGPISFGLAVRVSKQSDWLRVVLECRKNGDTFFVEIEDGQEYEIKMPLSGADPDALYEHIYQHILHWFSDNIESYSQGDYGTREIGFDIAGDEKAA